MLIFLLKYSLLIWSFTQRSSLFLTAYQREYCGLLLRGCGGDTRVLALLEKASSRLQSSSSAKVKAVQRDELLQCDFAPLPCFDSLFSTRKVVLQSHSSTEKNAYAYRLKIGAHIHRKYKQTYRSCKCVKCRNSQKYE